MVEIQAAFAHVPIGYKADFYHTLRTFLVKSKQELPLFDEAFDLFWRSNTRNLALLERHQHELEPRPRAGDYAIVAAAVAMIGLSIAAPIFLVAWLFSMFV